MFFIDGIKSIHYHRLLDLLRIPASGGQRFTGSTGVSHSLEATVLWHWAYQWHDGIELSCRFVKNEHLQCRPANFCVDSAPLCPKTCVKSQLTVTTERRIGQVTKPDYRLVRPRSLHWRHARNRVSIPTLVADTPVVQCCLLLLLESTISQLSH